MGCFNPRDNHCEHGSQSGKAVTPLCASPTREDFTAIPLICVVEHEIPEEGAEAAF